MRSVTLSAMPALLPLGKRHIQSIGVNVDHAPPSSTTIEGQIIGCLPAAYFAAASQKERAAWRGHLCCCAPCYRPCYSGQRRERSDYAQRVTPCPKQPAERWRSPATPPGGGKVRRAPTWALPRTDSSPSDHRMVRSQRQPAEHPAVEGQNARSGAQAVTQPPVAERRIRVRPPCARAAPRPRLPPCRWPARHPPAPRAARRSTPAARLETRRRRRSACVAPVRRQQR
mmetsp:Transcript_12855/g.42038  ORF Transcript_12855/g.42038 Transcript_12855/m.42038 type:complete len:228 (+) Transcript_12855:752-1435(+)